MKVYFSSSLRAKKLYDENFQLIFKLVEKFGHKNTSNFLITADSAEFYQRKGKNFAIFYQNMLEQIKKADICIFEVTLHSLGVGYCVNLALQMGKPVILLHQKGSDPVFFQGINSERLQIYEYEKGDLERVLKDALSIAKQSMDIRFTFFINPNINQFLDWIAKEKKIPRAVFIRSLIEEAMKKEKMD